MTRHHPAGARGTPVTEGRGCPELGPDGGGVSSEAGVGLARFHLPHRTSPRVRGFPFIISGPRWPWVTDHREVERTAIFSVYLLRVFGTHLNPFENKIDLISAD